MKILLLNPYVTIYKKHPTGTSPNFPMGLAYLAAYLERNSFEVSVLDILAEGFSHPLQDGNSVRYGLSDEEITRCIKKINPDVIGISSMFSAHARDVHSLAALVKKTDSSLVTILGGPHASINPTLTVSDPNVDFVVYGEGEETLCKLLDALPQKKFERVRGLAFKKGKKIIVTPRHPFITNLDDLPFPNRDLFPFKIYHKTLEKSPYLMRKPVFSVQTSRGCVGICTFCSIHAVWQHCWRARSAENVVSEIEFLVKKYGAREIHFGDDSIAADKKRMHQICDEIIKRGLDIPWTTPNGITYWTLDEELLKKMKKAGCYRLTFGIESGNVETRKFIGKVYSLEKAREVIKICNKLGLWTISTFILGFPYETKKQIFDTMNFAKDCGVDFAAFYALSPIPGTPVFEVAKKEKMVNFNETYFLHNLSKKELLELASALAEGGFKTKYFTKKQILGFVSQAYRQFWQTKLKTVFNPFYLASKVYSFESFKYLLSLILTNFKTVFEQLKGAAGSIRQFQLAPQQDA